MVRVERGDDDLADMARRDRITGRNHLRRLRDQRNDRRSKRKSPASLPGFCCDWQD
jgi:hypothetical protein